MREPMGARWGLSFVFVGRTESPLAWVSSTSSDGRSFPEELDSEASGCWWRDAGSSDVFRRAELRSPAMIYHRSMDNLTIFGLVGNTVRQAICLQELRCMHYIEPSTG